MMPGGHLATAAALGALSYATTGSTELAAGCFAGGFLIDLDHILSSGNPDASFQLLSERLVFLAESLVATATRLVRGPLAAILLSTGLGLAYVWTGILTAAASGVLPVSFCIATLSFLVYLPVRLLVGPRRRARPAPIPPAGETA